MIKSMTGYSKVQITEGEVSFDVEIRSLNSRYRDIRINLPTEIRSLEDDIRRLVMNRIKRGRIEISIRFVKGRIDTEYQVTVNFPLIESYLKALEEISDRFNINLNPGPESLSVLKDAVMIEAREPEINYIKEIMERIINESLDELDHMRLKEGKEIEVDLMKRLAMVERFLDEIEQRAPEVVSQFREKIIKRISEFLGDYEPDENRLLQEVAIFADRADITEEIVRLRSHIKQMKETIEMDGPVGRRLDFLIQEMNREVNTISSKAGDALISQRVVDIKSEIEKMREQVQNIE